MTPKISVIMPVYNTKEKYLREAIESILHQTFTDFELIIVNDGSTDKNIENIIKSYTDKRIRYFYQKNGGAASARNLAITKASGKYIAFMDSDDISLSDRLDIQYNFLEENSEIGCVGTKVEVIDSVNNKSFKFPNPTKHEEIERYLILKGCVFCQSSIMLRKEILDKNNFFYKTEYVPAEDYAFWLDLIGYTKFAVLKQSLLKYRYHFDNISNKQKNLQLQKSMSAQLDAIRRYCNIEYQNKEILEKFFCSMELTRTEIQTLPSFLHQFIECLVKKGFSKAEITSMFGRKFKKIYYHTRRLSGQLNLFKSPLNRLFNIPLSFRLFCLITRGVL